MKFEKLHALGNDFIVVDARRKKPASESRLPRLAERLCARHFGVGAGGLVLLMQSPCADFRMRVFGADGAETDWSCSAVSCACQSACARGIRNRARTDIETASGIVSPKLEVSDGARVAVTLDMGKPVFAGAAVPMAGSGADEIRETFIVDGHPFDVTAVRLLSPHLCVFASDMTETAVSTFGRLLSGAPQFPEGVDVDFICVKDTDHIAVRSYRRGAGPVFASGESVCAAAAACVTRGETARRVRVSLAGGTCDVEWPEGGGIRLSLSAERVFTGKADRGFLRAKHP